MNFSEKLIRLRKREGISQEELASYLEVSGRLCPAGSRARLCPMRGTS